MIDRLYFALRQTSAISIYLSQRQRVIFEMPQQYSTNKCKNSVIFPSKEDVIDTPPSKSSDFDLDGGVSMNDYEY